MQDRFKFNAIVSSYYDVDTPEDYQEFEPKFYLKNVDVFWTGEIGIDYDVLLDVVKKQSKNLTEKEIGQIMQHFEDNSYSPDCDFVTITPDNILQCTGLKDKNGKLIYEGDIVKIPLEWHSFQISKHYIREIYYQEGAFRLKPVNDKRNKGSFGYVLEKCECFEVIGNIHENKELLNE